ncbi:unnamed protein product [Calypogeia fissa]
MNAEVGAVFLQKAAPYLLIKGVLHKHGADGHTRRCLEEDEITKVMEALHDGEVGGHYGADNTVRKILNAGYWWPTLHKDVFTFVRGCDPCQRAGRPHKTRMHPLHSILPLAPFEKWGIDYIGPITPVTQYRRNCYILLATDYAMKWVEARATRKDDALTSARFLFEQIFTRFGPPLELVSDRGTHFLNGTVEKLTEKYKVKHRKITPYHPKCNGLMERANGIIGKILNKIVAEHKHDWDVKLFSAVYSYNLAYKSPTGQTPYFLVFGQTALVPIEFDIQTPRVTIVEREPERLTLAERAIQIEALEEARLIASIRMEHR